jgi:hypothetical protein
MAILRNHVRNPFVKKYLLLEMVARTIKNLLREQLRNAQRTYETLVVEPYKAVVVSLFNKVIGASSPEGAR